MGAEEVKDVLTHTAILWLRTQGVSVVEIAFGSGVSRATLYRILKRAEAKDYRVHRAVKAAILRYYKHYRNLLAEDKRVRAEINDEERTK